MTNSLATRFPALAAQLDPALNDGRTPDQVMAGTRETVMWRCPQGPDHLWSTPVVARTAQKNGCPYCAGRRASVSNHLASRPDLVAEFDHEANAPQTPETLAQSSRKRVWWNCPSGPDHRWHVSVAVRAKAGHGCPFCAGQRVSVTNSLQTRFPQAAAELDPALNDGLTPDQVTATAPRPATWTCGYGHTWNMTIRARTRALASGNGGCPYCYPHGASRRQLALASALAHALPGLVVDSRPPVIRTDGRPRYVDITIPELRLALEYDGSYYHRGREGHDGEKSSALRRAGWQVVRLREASLDPIDEHDLTVPVVEPVNADTLIPTIVGHLRNVLDSASLETLERELSQPVPAERPTWQWASPPPLFLEGLSALEAFVLREGHALPPSEHAEGDVQLGRWVMRQRRLYRAGKLPQPERQMLETQPGWSWDWRETRWNMFVVALNAFGTREGHLRVPQAHLEDGYPLGVKVIITRRDHRRGKLSADRVNVLKAMPGWTWQSGRQVNIGRPDGLW
ncbi:zinc-ribbon domain-containing protein [Streptomyces sp. NPDC002205]|uniref:zinc-ribbon domain-containing protein n=1 Tax=Streptomyces sp. NPDC002205 TaxID=3154411 RepID=UPI0033275353